MTKNSKRVVSISATSFQEVEYFPNHSAPIIAVAAVCYEDGKVKDEFLGCLPNETAVEKGISVNMRDFGAMALAFHAFIERNVAINLFDIDCDVVINASEFATMNGIFDLGQGGLFDSSLGHNIVDISTCLHVMGCEGSVHDYVAKHSIELPQDPGGYYNPLINAYANAKCYMHLMDR